ncbi:hypothetical protein [Paraglaciecola hydrolytica]|uniref:Uncharacterized protein n=1 Tax=Paraglaciecola hydrolytica TaxID=1799789 RepID=A0A136A2V4_9ALTE|nr:hypothetical protein [Paraglaciecola hydrolytica]KXI29565.1 hypothetical protein AX660_05790 [Paraglaciecola hydrolytica]
MLEREPTALAGKAYNSLAILYHKVPSWPVAFGSDKKAVTLFEQSILLDPQGIDSNYFYAEFLYDEGKYKAAQKRLLIAQQTPIRVDHELADSGRLKDVQELLNKVEKKLN